MNERISYINAENETMLAIIKNIRRNYYPSHKPPTTEYFLTDFSGQNLRWVEETNLKKIDEIDDKKIDE